MTGPLRDIQVIEIGNQSAVPYAGRLLAGLGATVVKIERPTLGDSVRRDVGRPSLFHYFNAGKKSVTLDWDNPKGLEVLRRLLSGAQIFLHELQPSHGKQLGLDIEHLRALNPNLAVVAVTGLGQTGPNADMPSTGFTSYHYGGLGIVSPMYGAEAEDGPLFAGGRQADLQAASYAALGSLASVFAGLRGRQPQGQLVDVSMVEATILCQESTVPMYSYQGVSPSRLGRVMTSAPAGMYPTKTQGFFIFCLTDDWWHGLVQLMGNPDWAADEVFATGTGRASVSDLLDALIAEWTARFTAAELYDLCQENHLPFAPANTAEELLKLPQLHFREFWVAPLIESGRQLPAMPGAPFVMAPGQFDPIRRGPELGEHTADILDAAGFSSVEIAALKAAGVA
jgi:formyl-CoA transferase